MRHLKTVSTSLATLAARLSAVAAMLVINGFAKHRMSDDEFGFWMILYSINLFTNGCDIGFRFTLGNRLAALVAKGPEAEEERRETFLAIFWQQAGFAVFFAALCFVLCPLAPWPAWFRITDPSMAARMVRMMPWMTALMMGTLPVALMWAVYFAYLEIKLASLLGAAVTLLQMVIFVVTLYRFRFETVIGIYFAFNILSGAAVTADVFVRRRWRFSLPNLRSITAITKSMARVSSHAFLITLASVLSMALGTIFSGASAGLAAAGDFSLIQKVFSLLVTGHLALLAPFPPKIIHDATVGNWDAVRGRLRMSLVLIWTVVFLIGGILLWWAHPLVLRLWSGQWITDYPLAALLLAWACAMGFGNTFSIFLNAVGLVKEQSMLAIVMVVPSLFLPALLGGRMGSHGVALGMLISLVPSIIYLPLLMRRAVQQRLMRN